jgi:hypothetical protein
VTSVHGPGQARRRRRTAGAAVVALLAGLFLAPPMAAANAPPTQQAKFTDPDGAASPGFGYTTAVDGRTLVVGHVTSTLGSTGSAFVYARAGGIWTQRARLTSDTPSQTDSFGVSVAIDNETIVVGAKNDDEGAPEAGAAYVFTRNGNTWTRQAKLIASDAVANARFGISVAIDGDTVVVGADTDSETFTYAGAAYVFTRNGNTWTQQAKLVASDAATIDQFGGSVAIAADTVVVGATGDDLSPTAENAGAAYVYKREGDTWVQQAKLVAADRAAFDYFGISVAIAHDTVVVGAILDDDAAADAGSASVFVRGGDTWTQRTKLVASDAAAGDRFGISVAIDGGTIVVGAYLDDLGAVDAGSAYVITRQPKRWIERAKLVASDGAAGDAFGISVAISGRTVAVGAFHDDDRGADSGSAYVFG